MHLQEFRPISPDLAGWQSTAERALIAGGAGFVAWTLSRGWSPAAGMAAITATVLWMAVRRLSVVAQPAPPALPAARWVASPIDELVDTIVDSAIDRDAEKIRFWDNRGNIGVVFEGPSGTRPAMQLPGYLASQLVDELAYRAETAGCEDLILGDRGEVTAAVRRRPVQLRIQLGTSDELAEIELVRRAA